MRTASLQVWYPMGGGAVNYSDAIEDLAGQVDSLDARRKGALFWLLGSGLVTGLQPPAPWAHWFVDARRLGYHFVITGEALNGTRDAWGVALTPTGHDSSQLLNSAIICVSTPLGLAIDRHMTVGAWVENAFFPLMQSESLRLFGDVAMSDNDEELDMVFTQPAIQRCVEYCKTALSRLVNMAPDRAGTVMKELLEGAKSFAPPDAL